MTLQQRYKVWLEAIGFKQIEHRTRKYIVMAGVIRDKKRWFFLGKAGALRISRTGNVTDAVGVSDIYKQVLLAWERKQNEN